jgi:hypothetical protein
MQSLMRMGAEFDLLIGRWARMPLGPERDDLCEVLNLRAAAIRAMPVDCIEGLAAKARALAWTCSLDHRGPDDFVAQVVAAFVEDVEHVAAMAA